MSMDQAALLAFGFGCAFWVVVSIIATILDRKAIRGTGLKVIVKFCIFELVLIVVGAACLYLWWQSFIVGGQ